MSREPITAARLLRWGDLHEDRRRRHGAARWGRWLGAATATALAAGVAAQAEAAPAAASRGVLAATVLGMAAVMLGTPFRMFWRPDAALLARLPIPGRALFDVAVVRCARASLAAAAVLAPAAAALAVADGAAAARHLALLAATATAAAALLPAVALAAGALVAGGKADALVRALGGGEVAAPPTTWLGLLPGLAAAAVLIAALVAAPWAQTGAATLVGPGPALLAGLAVGSIAAALLARRLGAGAMPRAVREVAALDVQRLAHLEVHPPTALERTVAARLGGAAALVHGKDARLVRRRYPVAMLAGAAVVAALWLVAALRPASPWAWALVVGAALAAYAQAVAARLASSPIELPFVATLPLAPAALRRAKLAYLATWTGWHAVLGAAPLAWAADDGGRAAAVVLGCAALAVGAGAARLRRGAPR